MYHSHRNITQHPASTQRPLIPTLDDTRRTGYKLHQIQQPTLCQSIDKRPAPQCRKSPTTVINELYSSPHAVYDAPTCSGSPRTSETNRKLKTEMCKNIVANGYCCWGNQCLFAHSDDERMKFTSVEEMHQYGLLSKADIGTYLSRVCCFWVRSGSCPYNTRCKSLHDPRLLTPTVTPSWLEHYTKFNKKDPTLILDRLHHCRMNGFIQVNPLVEPWIWNDCRLINGKMEDYEEIWNDTYRFVCNLDVPIFSTEEITSSKERGALSYSNMVCRKISDIHKLCIVAAMRRPSKIYRESGSHDANLDFTYEPTHCLNGQPCMILQLRFYRLLDYKQKNHLTSIEDVVEEISMQEYQRLANNLTTRAYEVVMDSKGKRSANLSIFFDVDITPCSNNKAKRVSKRGEENWYLEDKTLFCLPKNEAFSSSLPQTKPYVLMQPVDDSLEGHALIYDIIVHRIGSLLHEQGYLFGEFNNASLHEREAELKHKLISMMKTLERDFWPVTDNMDHIKKSTEERNQTEYHPSEVEGSSTTKLWDSFVSNLNASDGIIEPSFERLPVFQCITSKKDTGTSLPHIKPMRYAQPLFQSSSHNFAETTWKELLEGQTGAWAAAKYTHDTKSSQMYKAS